MPRTHPPYPPEFRHQMVELVRSGRSASELACDFECCDQTIRKWVRQAIQQPIQAYGLAHAGLVGIPDVSAQRRIALIAGLIKHPEEALEAGAVVTIRVSGPCRWVSHPLRKRAFPRRTEFCGLAVERQALLFPAYSKMFSSTQNSCFIHPSFTRQTCCRLHGAALAGTARR